MRRRDGNTINRSFVMELFLFMVFGLGCSAKGGGGEIVGNEVAQIGMGTMPSGIFIFLVRR